MPNDIFRKPLFWSALATITVGALLLLTAGGRELLDAKLYYLPQDALAYFMTRDPAERPLLETIAFIDLFLFVPAYGSLLFLLTRRMKAPLLQTAGFVLTTVALTADAVETSLVWMGLREIGWESGRLTATLSVASPLKWAALGLWILVFVLNVRRR